MVKRGDRGRIVVSRGIDTEHISRRSVWDCQQKERVIVWRAREGQSGDRRALMIRVLLTSRFLPPRDVCARVARRRVSMQGTKLLARFSRRQRQSCFCKGLVG